MQSMREANSVRQRGADGYERVSGERRKGERRQVCAKKNLASDLPFRIFETLIEPRLESGSSSSESEGLYLQYEMMRSC